MSIEVRRITKSFGKFTALRDVSLNVPNGSLIALLGPSGSGKTTLLRIIAGLEEPDALPGSQILFDQQDVKGLDVRRRQIGFVFQHYALFRHMNIYENIAFGLRVKPWSQRPSGRVVREKVSELLKLIQLEGLEKRYPAQLSGGQRQRVALARALAIEPKVLLLDEPFGALDAKVRQDLRRWLRRLHDTIQLTSLFVTHDQEEALETADRVVVMNQGKIEQEGTPEEVFHQPASEFVMNFLGNVNLFHGRVEDGKAVFGTLAVHQPKPYADGSAVKLFVRPHELDILVSPAGRSAWEAQVDRLQSAGPVVRVELLTIDGATVHVELSHERAAQLQLQKGMTVYVSPRHARAFHEDYAI